MSALSQRVKEKIRSIPDFPKPGILFRDLMPVFHDPILVSEMLLYYEREVKPWKPEAIVAIESRGFLLGVPLSLHLRIPFIPVRKQGKLPGYILRKTYTLEYGNATIEIQKDAIKKGQRVIVHDDLLATGGTALAAAELVEEAGGKVVGFLFIVELLPLKGREVLASRFPNAPVISLVQFAENE